MPKHGSGDTDAYKRQEFEPAVVGSVIIAEALLNEVREQNYKCGTLNVIESTFTDGRPTALSIDRNNDGKADGSAKVKRTTFGSLDSIDIDHDNDGRVDCRVKASLDSIGYIKSLGIDLDLDGKRDATIDLVRSPFGYVNELKLDKAIDGKVSVDARLEFDRHHSKYRISAANLDWNNDKKIDYKLKVDRPWTTIKRLKPE